MVALVVVRREKEGQRWKATPCKLQANHGSMCCPIDPEIPEDAEAEGIAVYIETEGCQDRVTASVFDIEVRTNDNKSGYHLQSRLFEVVIHSRS